MSSLVTVMDVLRSRARADARHAAIMRQRQGNPSADDYLPPQTIDITHLQPNQNHGTADQHARGWHRYQQDGEPVFGDSFRRRQRQREFFRDVLTDTERRLHFDWPIRPKRE